MKRRICAVLTALTVVCMLQACGSDEEVHTIEKSSGSASSAESGEEQSSDTDGTEQMADDAEQGSGYCFIYRDTEIYVDEDMEEVLSAIGEANSYYEAASCAFENELDKTYTYSGFQIMTYPTDDKDWISYILLQDDTVETAEGIRIGSSQDEVVAAYGEEYTEDGTMMVYEKDGMKLCFVINGSKVTSIQYLSTVLD